MSKNCDATEPKSLKICEYVKMGEYPGLPFDMFSDKPFELVYRKSYHCIPWNFQDYVLVFLGQFQGPLPSVIAAYTRSKKEELCRTLPILKPAGEHLSEK